MCTGTSMLIGVRMRVTVPCQMPLRLSIDVPIAHRPDGGDSAFRGAGPTAGHEILHDVRRFHHDAALPRDHHVDHPEQADIHHEAAGENRVHDNTVRSRRARHTD